MSDNLKGKALSRKEVEASFPRIEALVRNPDGSFASSVMLIAMQDMGDGSCNAGGSLLISDDPDDSFMMLQMVVPMAKALANASGAPDFIMAMLEVLDKAVNHPEELEGHMENMRTEIALAEAKAKGRVH